jgi:hypothetical protein
MPIEDYKQDVRMAFLKMIVGRNFTVRDWKVINACFQELFKEDLAPDFPKLGKRFKKPKAEWYVEFLKKQKQKKT